MGNERTFDTQLSTEPETVAVEDFGTGSFGNQQLVNESSDNSEATTNEAIAEDIEKVGEAKDPLKNKGVDNDNGDKPQDESFKEFTPQIAGYLISNTILYSIEKKPIKALISMSEKQKPTNSEGLKSDLLEFFGQVNSPWSYQDEKERQQKNQEEKFANSNQPASLSELNVIRLVIKEESKNWYKIDLDGLEGFITKQSVRIDVVDWLKKSHQKETGDETIKSEKKKELDERLKKEETTKINEEQKKSKQSEYKSKLINRSKLNLKISSGEKQLKEVKEEFEKKLKKKKGQKDKVVTVISKFTEEVVTITKELKETILAYNEANQYIKKEREKLLTEEEKAVIKEYKIKVLDEQEDKKTDHLNPEEIIKDIENKVLMSTDVFKLYQEGKKQQKIDELKTKLENQEPDEKEKEKIQEEIKKINNPAPTTKPEDFARKEILLCAGNNHPMKKSVEDEKALLHYLMKVSELNKDEKRGLYNYMINNLKTDSDINEVFGYDGDKINPETFSKKFPDLAFTLPSDLTREKLAENKKAFKKDKKALRKENISFNERRERKRKLKSDFSEKKDEIKAPHKSIREKSGLIKDQFKSDKKKLKKEGLPKKDYKSKLSERKDEFKNSKRDLREEKRENPGFLRGLWQKSRKDTAYNSILERLGYLSANRKENQGNIKRVRDNKSRKKSDLSLRTADEQTLMFFGLLHANKGFYLNAYELEYLRRTEGDSEKVKVKAIRFYEEYFKGRPALTIGFHSAAFDEDSSLFYELIILPGLLFTAFPSKYYQNGVPSKPSEVKDDELRFWHKDYFDRVKYKSESLEETGKAKSELINLGSNIPTDKLDLDWLKFLQIHPQHYLQAYELQKNLADETVPVSEKQEQLYAFYQPYASKFKDNGFATKEALWEKWNGNPAQFFKQIFPTQYIKGNKLVSPTQVYTDLWEALKAGLLETVKKESGMQFIGDDFGERTLNHVEKNSLAYGILVALGLASSDIFSKNSNVSKSILLEAGGLPALFTAFVPLNKTLIDYKRTTSFGINQSSIQHKLRFSNQPFDKEGIQQKNLNILGIPGEFKQQDPDNPSNYQQLFSTDQKKMLPNIYAGLKYDFLKNTSDGSDIINQAKFSATGFGQFFTPMGSKLKDRDENQPQTYSLISQMYPLIQQGTYNEFNYKQPWSIANLTGREKTDAFLNSIPDSPMFNYGLGLSYDQQFAKNFGVSASFNYAAVNAFPKLNEFNRLNVFSGKFGTSFKATLNYWQLNANADYNFAYTSDLTPNPNADNQDAVKGIGQQHILSGKLSIGNDFCEFTGGFTNDLMKGEDASTYNFKFSLNQFAEIKKGTFSAQIMVEKRPAINSMQIPSMWVVGGGFVFHIGNILPNQPR